MVNVAYLFTKLTNGNLRRDQFRLLMQLADKRKDIFLS